jgi:hypothetical protein
VFQGALANLPNAGQWLVGPVDRMRGDASHQVLAGVVLDDTA